MSFTEKYVEKAFKDGASDIHIVCGISPKYRIDGSIKEIESDILTNEQCEEIAKEL